MSEQSKRWYVGAMNDAYFVIDAPPRPSTDYVNPAQNVNVISAMGTDGEGAYRMVAEHNLEVWLVEIESACNAALLDIYDLSIANAPLTPEYARQTADCVGHRIGQIREAVAAIRVNSHEG